MAALTDLSDLVNRMTGGNSGAPENIWFYKAARVDGVAAAATIAGRTISLWRYDGTYGNGAIPTSGAVPTKATQGAMPFTNAASGKEKFLIQAGAIALNQGTLIAYDRLFHIGGLSGTSTADQTVQGSPASPAITRNTGGAGNFVFYEIYSPVGTSSTTLTMTYTNQDGTGGRTSTVNIGTASFSGVHRAMTIPLASGDTGVRAVEKIKLTATTNLAGNFGITIAKPIAYMSCGAPGVAGWRDFTTGLPAMPKIDDDSCISFLWMPNGTAAPELFTTMSFVEK